MSHSTTANTSALANAGINATLLANLGLMMLAALASPLIYRDPQPVTAWLVVWLAPLVFASVFFIFAKVVMPSRIAKEGQKTFFKFAWVFLALFLLAHWQDTGSHTEAQKQTGPTFVEPAPSPAKPAFQFDPSTARLTGE